MIKPKAAHLVIPVLLFRGVGMGFDWPTSFMIAVSLIVLTVQDIVAVIIESKSKEGKLVDDVNARLEQLETSFESVHKTSQEIDKLAKNMNLREMFKGK